jgi:predicted TIM-barrel fold metal-dependent hydrolase
MPRRPLIDDVPRFPIPLANVSNGEWCPSPPSAKQHAVAKLLREEADRNARRLGMSRRDFLRTAAGTATAFMVLNKIHGLAGAGDTAVLPVSSTHCEDLDAGRTLLDQEYFVMDVQTHHADLTLPYLDIDNPAYNPGFTSCLRFPRPGEPPVTCTDAGLQLLSQENFVKELFVDSETTVGVISGVPEGTILPPETMAATRDLVNQLAGSERALMQCMIDPKTAPGTATAIDSMEHQVNDLGARALKCYTGVDQWWLDDELVSYPMLEEATRLGLRIINVHKGLGSILGPMAADYVLSRDLPKVVADWPHLRFVAYHSGYEAVAGQGITEFLDVLRSMPAGHRKRVYAEIGSTFALTFLQSPEMAAHLMGQLLQLLGSKRIIWGTDSIWWGSPQWQIDAFKTLEIPPAMQDEFGYPALTASRKRRILGRNAARLYRVSRGRRRYCTIPDGSVGSPNGAFLDDDEGDLLAAAPGDELYVPDNIDRLRAEQGGFRAGRSFRTYGPRTRREFLSFMKHGADRLRALGS